MYSPFTIARKYLLYRLRAANGKGHGIHSPFVFDFVIQVLNGKSDLGIVREIESRRSALLADKTTIEVEDFGAGSAVIRSNQRRVDKIAASSLKAPKYAQLLNRIAAYYQPAVMIELGTSLGITAAYLASGNPKGKLYTLEGSAAIAAIARQSFSSVNLSNIELREGDFTKSLPVLLNELPAIDLAFVDGNHRKKPTLDYFNQLLAKSTSSSVFIFDDIHWSAEMEEAWEQIRKHPAVTLSIDLFFIGLVFFDPSFKVKQEFVIQF